MSVELFDLVGEHVLTGVDHGETRVGEGYWTKDANVVRFVLDGKTYVATEDPEDGYRSALGTLEIVTEPRVENTFAETRVLGRKRTGGWDDEVLEFIAVDNGKTVLEIGTAGTSDYYPYFVGRFQPANLPINEEVQGNG